MARRRFLLLGSSLVAALALTREAPRAGEAPAPPAKAPKTAPKFAYARDIAPILAKYCTNCHGGKRPKGALSLERFKSDDEARKEPKIWEAVAQNLRSGDMPPTGRPK